MRRSTTLSIGLYSCLTLTLCLSLTGCWENGPTQEEIDKANIQAANERAAQEAEKQKQREKEAAESDGDGLVATADPRVFKATKVLPKPESSVNAVKPEYPALGYEHTYEGAEAVALYFQELLSYSANSGDVSGLEEICLQNSEYCQAVIQDIKQNELEGDWHEGIQNKDTKVIKWGVPPVEKNVGEYSFIITSTISDYTYFDRPKMLFKKKRGYKIEAFTNLSFIDGKWKVISAGSEIK